MVKGKPVLFVKSDAIKNRPGLALQHTTDKAGHDVQRWRKTGVDAPGEKSPGKGAQESVRGSKQGYGTHNMEVGDSVQFEAGEFKGSGTIKAVGKDGAKVEDSSGREHNVHWHEVRGFQGAGGGGKEGAKEPGKNPAVLGKQDPIPAEQFSAADYAKSHDQAGVTVEDILRKFPPDTKDKIEAAIKRLESIEDTKSRFKKDGKYEAEREVLHARILAKFFTPEAIEQATPAKGEKPVLVLLGGRGGSGKSTLTDGGPDSVADVKKFIKLDPDEIKAELPEYEGWNAAQVHEESSDICKRIVAIAKGYGLNLILDKTMSDEKVVKQAQEFMADGYGLEAHYMHLPRQNAAERAVDRFLGKTNRLVPPEVILQNTENEKVFDKIRQLADRWSFRDNNVPKGSRPILISRGGKAEERGTLAKALQKGRILFVRGRKCAN